MNLNIFMIAAGLLLLVGLALWTLSLVPISIGMAVILMLAIRATAGNRWGEPIALLTTFALSLTFVFSSAREMVLFDVSPKFFSQLTVLAIFAVATSSMLAAGAYFLEAVANMKPEKRVIAMVVAPVMMLVPQLFTERGNTYRKRFVVALIVFGACFDLLITIRALGS